MLALGGPAFGYLQRVLQFVSSGAAHSSCLSSDSSRRRLDRLQARLAHKIGPARPLQGLYPHVRSMGPCRQPDGHSLDRIVFESRLCDQLWLLTTDFLLFSAYWLPIFALCPSGAGDRLLLQNGCAFHRILPGAAWLVVLQNGDGSLMHLGAENVVAAHPGAGLPAITKCFADDVRYPGPGLRRPGNYRAHRGFMSRHGRQLSAFTAISILRHLPAAHRPSMPKDEHYVLVGRIVPMSAWSSPLGAALLVIERCGIMDYVQALFSFFSRPAARRRAARHVLEAATKQGGFWVC